MIKLPKRKSVKKINPPSLFQVATIDCFENLAKRQNKKKAKNRMSLDLSQNIKRV